MSIAPSTLADLILPEFDEEMAGTRKVLDRVPNDKLDWKAHPKSNAIRWVASHLVEITGWVEGTLTADQWDASPPGTPPYRTPLLGSRAEMLAAFDREVEIARTAIAATSDDDFQKPWSLLNQGQTVFTMPRLKVIRSFVLNHVIHHRAPLRIPKAQ